MNVTPAEGGPERLRRALLAHYDRERRVLPWRGETDPYRVLVSEVILQQTRVETVKGYYEPWLRRFPDREPTGMPILIVAPTASRGARLRWLPGSRRT